MRVVFSCTRVGNRSDYSSLQNYYRKGMLFLPGHHGSGKPGVKAGRTNRQKVFVFFKCRVAAKCSVKRLTLSIGEVSTSGLLKRTGIDD